jgi:hypothetical protein
MIRLLRWCCDPALLEAVEGDLLECYGALRGWRVLGAFVSVCARRPRAGLRSLAAALLVLALTGAPGRPVHYTVYARDPAGAFALEIREGRAVAASFDGASVRVRDLVQSGDTVIVRGGDDGADFRIAIKPEGGISWLPRHSVSH